MLKSKSVSAARATLEAKVAREKAKMISNNRADQQVPHARELLERLDGWKQSKRFALSQEKREQQALCGDANSVPDAFIRGVDAVLQNELSISTPSPTPVPKRRVSCPIPMPSQNISLSDVMHDKPRPVSLIITPTLVRQGGKSSVKMETAVAESRWGYSRIALPLPPYSPQDDRPAQDVADTSNSGESDDATSLQTMSAGSTDNDANAVGHRRYEKLLTRLPEGILRWCAGHATMPSQLCSSGSPMVEVALLREKGGSGSPPHQAKPAVESSTAAVNPATYNLRVGPSEKRSEDAPSSASRPFKPLRQLAVAGFPREHAALSCPGSCMLTSAVNLHPEKRISGIPTSTSHDPSPSSLSMPLLRLGDYKEAPQVNDIKSAELVTKLL